MYYCRDVGELENVSVQCLWSSSTWGVRTSTKLASVSLMLPKANKTHIFTCFSCLSVIQGMLNVYKPFSCIVHYKSIYKATIIHVILQTVVLRSLV